MACKTCGQAGSSCGCDTSCFGGTANWLVPVKVAPPIEMASRKFAYVTPDNIVWVVNHDGTELIPLSDNIDWIIDADEALPSLGDADPLRIYRQDDKMYIVNEAKTDWIDLTESSSFDQVQADWNVTDEASKAFIKNKPTIPMSVDFEKSKLTTETTITATSPEVILTATVIKTELVVNSLETELRSGMIYIHNLTANIGATDIGNSLDFKIIIPIPSGMIIPSDRLPLMAVSDTGGTAYSNGFVDFKTDIGKVSNNDSEITITGSFYASANCPSNMTAFNFRDVIVKFL